MIGERFREARKKAGMTQADLAEEAGTTQDYISDLERGKSDPTISMLRRIAHAMMVNPADLLE